MTEYSIIKAISLVLLNPLRSYECNERKRILENLFKGRFQLCADNKKEAFGKDNLKANI